MSQIFNVYCDESCHLKNDHQQVMVLGALWCPLEKTREISVRIREIKVAHGLSPMFEVKWTKVSPAQKKFYLDLIDYFFDDDDLHFRALIVPDKTKLQHDKFGHDHDTWYYKMYDERIPDLRRCERIRWPRPVIEHSDEPVLKVWENTRKGERRILLWLEKQEYLVVLAERNGYLLPWTAYLVTEEHRKKKLQREYEAFKKANAAF